MPDDVMTALPDKELLRLSEVHAMRALVDAINAQGRQSSAQSDQIVAHMEATNRTIEKFGLRIENMNERLIRLEEQKHGREIDSLREEIKRVTKARDIEVKALGDKIDTLERKNDERNGAKQFIEMLPKFAPWLVSIIAAIAAWQSIKAN